MDDLSFFDDEKELHTEFDKFADKLIELKTIADSNFEEDFDVYNTYFLTETEDEKLDLEDRIIQSLLNKIIELDKVLFVKLNCFIEFNKEIGIDYTRIENGLNSIENRKKTGIIILPKAECIWSGESAKSNHSDDEKLQLEHFEYYYLENKYFKKFQINCVFLDSLDKQGKMVNNSGQKIINLAGTPLSKEHIVEPIVRELNYKGRIKKRIFFDSIEDIERDEEIKNRILNTIIEANKEKYDILVFPEAMVSKKIIEKVIECIKEHPQIFVKLIVLPSIWERQKDQEMGVNYSIIIDGRGKEICRQEKLFCYKKRGNGLLEGISPGNQINLIYLNDFGCMAILICRTFLITEFREFCNLYLGTSMHLCPAYSTGVYDFQTSIEANKELAVNSVWCNLCSMEKNDEIVVITNLVRGKKEDADNLVLKRSECGKECMNPDGVCIAKCSLSSKG